MADYMHFFCRDMRGVRADMVVVETMSIIGT
jgi:hypothetical protein